MGMLLRAQGSYGDAGVLRASVGDAPVAIAKPRYPQGHADLAGSLNSLGLLAYDRGAYTESAGILRTGVGDLPAGPCDRKDRYPKGHPDLAESLANLGMHPGPGLIRPGAVPYDVCC